jgi:hypothetical protein
MELGFWIQRNETTCFFGEKKTSGGRVWRNEKQGEVFRGISKVCLDVEAVINNS